MNLFKYLKLSFVFIFAFSVFFLSNTASASNFHNFTVGPLSNGCVLSGSVGFSQTGYYINDPITASAYGLTVSDGGGCLPPDGIKVRKGSGQLIDLLFQENYSVANVELPGQSYGGSATYTFKSYYGSLVTDTQVTVVFSVPPPVDPVAISMSASPSSIRSGTTSMINWSASNATSCNASGGSGTWAGNNKPTAGSYLTSPLSSNTSFNLFCEGPGPSDYKSVMVFMLPPPSVTINANPLEVASGGTSYLTWESTQTDSCTITNGTNTIATGVDGAQTVNGINNTTTYTANCVLNPIVTPGSCSGSYNTTALSCVGVLGGNSCWPIPQESCSEFNPNITTGPDACEVAGNPWCHHECQVQTDTTSQSCQGLNQTQCGSHSSCSWTPQVTIPGGSATDSVTVTVADIPTVDVSWF